MGYIQFLKKRLLVACIKQKYNIVCHTRSNINIFTFIYKPNKCLWLEVIEAEFFFFFYNQIQKNI